jgi:digeranylgeranylglycerophospholipid reductase
MTRNLTPDVLIVGLGPGGASAARAAAAAGRRVFAFDRKLRPGVPVQCAEFVPAMLGPTIDAVRVARRQRITEMQTFVEDEIADRKEGFPGVMVDRAKFDQHLVAQAGDAGAECRFDTTITEISSDGLVRLSSGETIDAPVVIGADGPRSRIGGAIGSANTALVVARQVSVPLLAAHLATDIFLSANYRGGYGWLFPRGNVANLGLGVEPAAREHLKSMLESLHQQLIAEGRVGGEILNRTGGAIPVGGMVGPIGRLGRRVVLLCGDAAGLTNPITGAGISSAVLSGTLAGESAANWLAGNENAAADYREELEDLFGPALARAVRRRQAILARYNDAGGPSRRDLRSAWIAYPEYWAA